MTAGERDAALLLLAEVAEAPRTPASVRRALAAVLERATLVRSDDLGLLLAALRALDARSGTAAHVVEVARGACFWSLWDSRYP